MPAFCAAIIWLMSKPPAPLSALRSKPPCSSSSSSSTYLLQSTCTFVFSSTLSCSRRGQNSSSLSFLTMWKCRLRSALAHTLCLSSTSTSLKNSSSTSYFLPLLVPERQRLVGELDLLVLDVRQIHRHIQRVLALRPLDWRPQSLRVRHASRRLLLLLVDGPPGDGYDSLPLREFLSDPSRVGQTGWQDTNGFQTRLLGRLSYVDHTIF